jgi:hypothetical protein
MAANKVPGIRAALCDDAETARGARLWNNANVLCLSLRRTSEVVAKEIVESWFNTSFESNEVDDACLAQLDALEEEYFEIRDEIRDTRYEIRDIYEIRRSPAIRFNGFGVSDTDWKSAQTANLSANGLDWKVAQWTYWIA